jgi:hypothetical protein
MGVGTGKKIRGGTLLLACCLLLVAAGGFHSAGAQEEKATTNWRYTWTAPTTGSPPSYYVAEIRRDGDEVQVISHIGSPTLNIAAEYGHDYEIRVAAVDAFGRQGQFSGWSARTTAELTTPRL